MKYQTMKRIHIILALAVAALLGNITASAQDATTYFYNLQVSVFAEGYKSVGTPTPDMNEGISTNYTCKFYYQTTRNFQKQIVKDFLVVECGNELTEFTYNGLTYTRVQNTGEQWTNGNLNYGIGGPELHLFASYCEGAPGERVLSKLDVDFLGSKATDTSNYSTVMKYSNGTVSPRGNDNLKEGAGGTFVYLRPTYTTISAASYPMIYMEACTEGGGTEDDPYLLSTAGHLYWFSYMVASGNEYICGKLTKDITVNEGVLNSDGSLGDATNLKPWFPIGYDSSHAFRGKLMGDGHTVSGLYYNDVTTDFYSGLFGYAVAAEISRVGVTDTYIAGKIYVGGIIGNVIMKNTENTSIIKECFFQGTLSAKGYCGGIAGGCGNGSAIYDCYARVLPLNKTNKYGGILGDLTYGKCQNCYYDSNVFGSTASSSSIIALTSAQFASGEVASLLNHRVETGEELFRQRIGKDSYPIFNDSNKNNYVFRTSDGGYTNSCTHPSREMRASKASTCVSEGNIAYYFCDHPACKAYYANFPGAETNKLDEAEAVLFRVGDTHPKVIAEKSNVKWKYNESTIVSNKKYHNAMTLTWEGYPESAGTYKFLYPIPCGQSKLELNYRVDMTPTTSPYMHSSVLKFFVNKVECKDLKVSVAGGSAKEGTAVIDGIAGTNDVVEVELIVTVEGAYTRKMPTVVIGMGESIDNLPAEHRSFTYCPGDDCLHEGLLPHFQCEHCGVLFVADEDNPHETDLERFKTDEYVVGESDLYRPAYDSHIFLFAEQPNRLYANRCNRCNFLDTESWVAREAINGEDLHLTGNDTDGFAANEDITLAFSNNYTVPVAFTAPTLKYTAPTYAGAWNSWGVPFDVTTTDLADAGFEAAYVEGIHRYDTDEDGQIDRTTLEVIRIKNGRLRAGTPYLIHPKGEERKIELTLTDVAFKVANDIQPIHTETALAAYDIIPTFVKIPATEAAGNYYIVGSDNSLGLTTEHVPALDWYLTITPKGTIFDELPAEVKSIGIRVVGEEDDVTGIVTRYADNKVREEIYDLSGRRINAPAKGQLYIQGGKVKLNK